MKKLAKKISEAANRELSSRGHRVNDIQLGGINAKDGELELIIVLKIQAPGMALLDAADLLLNSGDPGVKAEPTTPRPPRPRGGNSDRQPPQ